MRATEFEEDDIVDEEVYVDVADDVDIPPAVPPMPLMPPMEEDEDDMELELPANVLNAIPAYKNWVRRHPNIFAPIMYKALKRMELMRDEAIRGVQEILGEDVELQRPANPINNAPGPYLKRKFRTKLSYGIRGDMFPQNFQKNSSKSSKKR